MKRTIFLIALICYCTNVSAQDPDEAKGTPVSQDAGRIYRTEAVPFDSRQDAEARNLKSAGYYMALDLNNDNIIEWSGAGLADADTAWYRKTIFNPEYGTHGTAYCTIVDIPYAWTDGNIYLHLENIGSAYEVYINGTPFSESKVRPIAVVEDSKTPADFYLSPAIREGKNMICIATVPARVPQLESGTPASKQPRFENSYLYFQNKRSIRDVRLELVPDSTQKFGILKLDMIVQNSFNYDEQVTVGYDIYSPQGKLLDFNIKDVLIPGRSIDTVSFNPYIYHTYENKWEAGGKTNPPLYKVMIFTRRDGAYKEYMPFKVGFGKTELKNGRLMRLGKELQLVRAQYNAAADPKTTLAELKALKLKGTNTICPDYPQPAWFYALCDEVGLYVIDRANINIAEKSNDRTVGGTLANAPALADDFVERVKGMYYRSRNFSCVIAYALGGKTGNGYNMYKAYQWLKSVEDARPVICEDADGEWNTDL